MSGDNTTQALLLVSERLRHASRRLENRIQKLGFSELLKECVYLPRFNSHWMFPQQSCEKGVATATACTIE